MSRLKHFLLTIFYKLPRFLRSLLSRAIYRPKLGKKVDLSGWTIFSQDVSIGDYTYMMEAGFIGRVRIGKFSSIAQGLTVGLASHPFHSFSTLRMFGAHSPFRGRPKPIGLLNDTDEPPKVTSIGNDVWIGANVTIKGGLTIGDGAAIGAGSMVTHDVEPFAIVAGNPARLIRYRFDEEKRQLLRELAWWDWDIETIYANLKLLDEFDTNLRSRLTSTLPKD
jgi:acetyltransferase-like isoleucine patch superfamily enzyme